jgi:hypothetical protein
MKLKVLDTLLANELKESDFNSIPEEVITEDWLMMRN